MPRVVFVLGFCGAPTARDGHLPAELHTEQPAAGDCAPERHGFLENVVTHPDFRGLGHGSAVVRAALAQAWAADCHHVLMQSGRTDPRVHRFFEHLGFVPGRRTAYVAP